MDALASFIFGIISGLLCCLAYAQWQAYYGDDTEREPLLGFVTGRPRTLSNAHTATINSGTTLSEPANEHHGIAGLTWLSSRLFSFSSSRPPRRPRLDTATISSPIHAPVVGSYLPVLRSMMRPPPLPALGDASVRWADYGRKKELAQSVLQHLTREPPLGRHLRMAVRAVLHLSQISPEAMAIDMIEEFDVPLTGSISPSSKGKALNNSTRDLVSIRQRRSYMRRKTIAPLLQEATHEEKDNEDDMSVPVKLLKRSVTTSAEPNRPLSDPALLEAIARFHAHEIARKDNLQTNGTPHATPTTSNTGTISGIDDTMRSRWDTAVLVAPPSASSLLSSSPTPHRLRHPIIPTNTSIPSPLVVNGNDDPDATPRVSRMVLAQDSARSSRRILSKHESDNGEDTDTTFAYSSDVHPMDDKCLSMSPDIDTSTINGNASILEENELSPSTKGTQKMVDDRQLRTSFDELQQRKRNRKRGDLLSTLMDMSVISIDENPSEENDTSLLDATILANNDNGDNSEQLKKELNQLLLSRQSIYSQQGSRPTSSAFDTDASFYTPPETPHATVRTRSSNARTNSSRMAEAVFSPPPSLAAMSTPQIQLSPPLPDNNNNNINNNNDSQPTSPTHPRKPHSTRRRNTPSSASNSTRISLDTPFFTSEQSHEWHVPGYGRVKFTDHCPQVFAELRRHFGIQLSDIDEALRNPFEQVTRTAGKSEAIFFTTHAGEKDAYRRKFLFKTLRGSEPENLKAFLPRYLSHVRQHPDTLLPRYLGMFTFERPANSTGFPYSMNTAHQSSSNSTPAPNTPTPTTSSTNGNGNGPNHLSTSPTPLSSSPTAFTTRLNDVVGTIARDFTTITSPLSPSSIRGGGGGGAAASMSTSSQQQSGEPIPMPTTDDAFPVKMTLVLMSDVFDTPLAIHERYDFKGSTVGRHTLPLGKAEEVDDVSQVTMKELDFRHRLHSGKAHYFTMDKRTREQLLQQLELDTALLREFDFMDYSVLIGVHKCSRGSVSKSYRTFEPSGTMSRTTTSRSTATASSNNMANMTNTGTTNTVNTGNGSLWSTPSIYSLTSNNDGSSPGRGRSRLVNFISKLIWTRRHQHQLEEGGATTSTLSSNRTASTPAHTFNTTDLERGSNTSDAYEPVSLWIDGISSSGLPKSEIYFIGIIDILQRYTLFKKIERGIKGANVHLRGAVDAKMTGARHGSPPMLKTPKKPGDRQRPHHHHTRSNSDSHGKRAVPLASTWSNGAVAVREMLTLERDEFSVEEPGRYAERLLAFVRSVLKEC